jgi:hypothetical protein
MKSRFKSMTKTSVFLHCGGAAALAFGIYCGQVLKAQNTAAPAASIVRIGQNDVIPETGFDAGVGMYQGIVLAGANPPSPGDWPCSGGGGDAQCSSIPSGGFVIPFPLPVLAAKSTGEILWTFTTTTASGTATLDAKITQGSKTIFTGTGTGTLAPNGIYYVYFPGAKLSGSRKGAATLTVTTTVGSAKITGKTTLYVQ